ncbi:MAG: 2Fe-2S iron-sulfur cluster-binding protein [Oleiphilus sp.]
MFTNEKKNIGIQWHDLQVKDIIQETNRAVTITLESLDEDLEFYFQAGQFINLMVDIDGERYCRSYSISSAPYEEVIKITVQAISGGVVSNYLNTRLEVGMVLRCSEACGEFITQSTVKQKLFLAAGSGITPIISLIKNHLYTSSDDCHLFYFSRSYEETIFVQEISSLCRLYANRLYVHHWHSSSQGRFDFDLGKLKRINEAIGLGPDVYLCGPLSWMDKLKASLKPYRFGLGNIYSEEFTAHESADHESTESSTHKVFVTILGSSYELEANTNESLLSAMRRHKVPVSFGCELGKCGCCIAKVLSGELDNSSINFLTEDELKQGYTLCCQAKVKSTAKLEQC